MSVSAAAMSAVLKFAVPAALLGVAAAWIWAIQRRASGRALLSPPAENTAPVPWDIRAIPLVVVLYVALNFAAAEVQVAVTGRSGVPEEYRKAHSTRTEIRPESTPRLPGRLPSHQVDRPRRTVMDLLMLQAVIYGLILFTVPALLRLLWGARLADLGLSYRDLRRQIARGVVACLLVIPVCYTILAACRVLTGEETDPHPVILLLEREFTARTLALALLTAVVLAPLAEELLFRGVLLGSLEKLASDTEPEPGSRVPNGPGRPLPSPSLPNVITSFLFAAMHAEQWPAPVPLFVLALVLGWLRNRTGSLWAPIALHASFNGLSTLFLVLQIGSGLHESTL